MGNQKFIILIVKNGKTIRGNYKYKGDYSHLKNGMKIDLRGTTTAQYYKIKNAFQKAVNMGKVKKLYCDGKPKE